MGHADRVKSNEPWIHPQLQQFIVEQNLPIAEKNLDSALKGEEVLHRPEARQLIKDYLADTVETIANAPPLTRSDRYREGTAEEKRFFDLLQSKGWGDGMNRKVVVAADLALEGIAENIQLAKSVASAEERTRATKRAVHSNDSAAYSSAPFGITR